MTALNAAVALLNLIDESGMLERDEALSEAAERLRRKLRQPDAITGDGTVRAELAIDLKIDEKTDGDVALFDATADLIHRVFGNGDPGDTLDAVIHVRKVEKL